MDRQTLTLTDSKLLAHSVAGPASPASTEQAVGSKTPETVGAADRAWEHLEGGTLLSSSGEGVSACLVLKAVDHQMRPTYVMEGNVLLALH